MDKQRLLERLEQLRAELLQTESVDRETLTRLEKVSDDIQRALDEQADESDELPEPVTGLKDLLLKFESEHPQLSDTIGRVADALAAMGL